MNPQSFFKNLLKDIKTNLSEEFDKNFERQAFFDKPWPQRKLRPGDNILNQHGGAGLRGSIMAKTDNRTVTWMSSLPYASIHNQGGEIVITAQMKKFFWAMYYKSSNALVYSTKTKGVRNNKRNNALSTESDYWKALALKKVGSKLKNPERRYIGTHPKVKAEVARTVDHAVKRLGEEFKIEFKKMTP